MAGFAKGMLSDPATMVTANGQHQAMLAARVELDYILGRWRMLPGEDRATSLMLDESLEQITTAA